MPPLRLYSAPLSMFGAKADIALREKGVDFDLVMVPFAKGDRDDPKHPEVLRINPKGQAPVLVHGEVELFDSTLIFESGGRVSDAAIMACGAGSSRRGAPPGAEGRRRRLHEHRAPLRS